ncbi:mercury resistance system transport protein MerF [uncultured Nisaea sp.]|uniref:mercury resistance system transport protein MerF n=1 Tax=uncultured Nisaea sp. TaxID=538215 RepID=UPI0030EC428D
MDTRLLKIGALGTVVTAICCFTPVLVVLMGAIGLSWATGYLDLVLLPALVFFISIVGVALWRRIHPRQS